jgi:uncharacterized membrane protein
MNKYSIFSNVMLYITIIVFLSFIIFKKQLLSNENYIYSAVVGISVILIGLASVILYYIEEYKSKKK